VVSGATGLDALPGEASRKAPSVASGFASAALVCTNGAGAPSLAATRTGGRLTQGSVSSSSSTSSSAATRGVSAATRDVSAAIAPRHASMIATCSSHDEDAAARSSFVVSRIVCGLAADWLSAATARVLGGRAAASAVRRTDREIGCESSSKTKSSSESSSSLEPLTTGSREDLASTAEGRIDVLLRRLDGSIMARSRAAHPRCVHPPCREAFCPCVTRARLVRDRVVLAARPCGDEARDQRAPSDSAPIMSRMGASVSR